MPREKIDAPEVHTSNTGRRYVNVCDLMRSEAGRAEIKQQAELPGSPLTPEPQRPEQDSPSRGNDTDRDAL